MPQAVGATGDGGYPQSAGVENVGEGPGLLGVSSGAEARSSAPGVVAERGHRFRSYEEVGDSREGASWGTTGSRLSSLSDGGAYGAKVNVSEGGTGAGEVEESRDDLVRFTLTNATGLEEIYFVYEPDGWESARSFAGLEEGISVTLRTEASARRLLESEEEVLIPGGVDLGFGGFAVEGREATEVEQVTCLYDHNGYTFLGAEIPAEIDIPCHTPKYREHPSINEGTGTPISLKEGEYRFIGKIDGEETSLRSFNITNVDEGGVSPVEGDPGTGEADGGATQPLSLRDAGRYLGMAAAGVVVLSALVTFSLIWGRKRRSEDREEEGSPGEDELLSNEERVLRELKRNDGRMKQQTLVESLGWTEAKTSQVVNDMHGEEAIEKYRLGRENVLSMPEEEREDNGEA